MKIFGTIDSFVETTDQSLKLGRLVANFGFLKALLQHGSFDQYQIFCPTHDNLNLLKQKLEQHINDDAILSKTVLSHHFNLPDALQNTDFSAFHVGGWSWYLPRLAFLRARYATHSMPLTGIIHSIDTPDMPRQFREMLRAPLQDHDSIICTSSAGQQAFQHYIDQVSGSDSLSYDARLDTIPLGVDEAFFNLPPQAECRQQAGLPADKTILLYIGRLSVSTKADLVPMLYQFKYLLRETAGQNCHLLLAGGCDNANRVNLEQVIGELELSQHVTVKTDISDQDKANLYGAADIFVSPIDNFQETFGISVIEAMASGLPVIASDFDGYRDLVDDGETGLRLPVFWQGSPPLANELRGILEPNMFQFAQAQSVAVDMQAFYQSTLTLLLDPDKRHAMGQAGREKAARLYAWPQVIKRYEQLWQSLKQQAQQSPAKPCDPDPDLIDYEAVFGHYPTAILPAETPLKLTPLGHAIVSGDEVMPATYQDISLLTSADLGEWLIGRLAQETVSIQRLCDEVLSETGLDARFTRFQLSWFIKYGLVGIDFG